MTFKLINADCANVKLAPESFDAMLSDAPYGFSFLDNSWDKEVPPPSMLAHLAKALKPGAPILIFGGPRTFHHLASSLEAAGLEIRDCLCWLYGQGMPKSQEAGKAIDQKLKAKRKVVGQRVLTGNAGMSTKDKGGTYAVAVGSAGNVSIDVTEPSSPLAKLWNGYGTGLKPAWEPIIVARKPMIGTLAENIIEHGVGPLNIDGCRVKRDENEKPSGWSVSGSPGRKSFCLGDSYPREPKEDNESGRHPANVLLDSMAAKELDASFKKTKSTPFRGNVASGSVMTMKKRTPGGYEDQGGVSRFFQVFESDPSGPILEAIRRLEGEQERFSYCPKVTTAERGESTHPTMKPIKLIEYLARLILPAGNGKLLVPFSGSGSEMIGALNAGWQDVTGIEINKEYIDIAKRRLSNE